jgi:hypothetical protein
MDFQANTADYSANKNTLSEEIPADGTILLHSKLVIETYTSFPANSFSDTSTNSALNEQALLKEAMSQQALYQQALSQQVMYQAAIYQTEQLLIAEILLLNALSRYYQRLSANSSFYANPYFSPDTDDYSDRKINPYFVENTEDTEGINNYPQHHNFRHSYPHRHKGYSLPNPSRHGFSHNIIDTARHYIGRPVWAFSKFAALCHSGYLGCAATVSELLKESGIKIPGSASVSGVVHELSDLGWHKIKINNKNQFHAGDIVFGLNGEHAHIGIITEANNNNVVVCDNSSSSGTLKERTIESGGSFTPNGRFAGNLYVMRQNG